MRFHTARETYGIRWWLCRFKGEFYWWPLYVLHLGFSRNDEGLHAHVRLLMFSLFLGYDRWPLWSEGREFSFYIADWRVNFTPYGREHEWREVDPWWIRGVRFDIADAVLGRMKYTETVTAEHVACVVPMPEGSYAATAKILQATRKRSRWFGRTTTEVWLDIPKGIPHAGKGENSWDCGDDGLFGIGGSSVSDAIERARASVLRDRKLYGHASDQAMRDAIA